MRNAPAKFSVGEAEKQLANGLVLHLSITDLPKSHQPNQGLSPAISRLVNYSRRQLCYLEPWSRPERVEPKTTSVLPGVLPTKPSRQEKFSLPRTVVAKFFDAMVHYIKLEDLMVHHT